MNAATRCAHAWLISNQVHELYFSVTPCLLLVNYLSALSDAKRSSIPITGGSSAAEGCSLGSKPCSPFAFPWNPEPFPLSQDGIDRGSLFLTTKHTLQDVTKKTIPKGIHDETSSILLFLVSTLFSSKNFSHYKMHESMALSLHCTQLETRYNGQHVLCILCILLCHHF